MIPLILLIFANDPTEPLAEVQQEMQSLQNILNPIAERLQYDIQILEYSSVDALIQQLDDNRDRLILLHFAGHSNSEVLKLDQGVAHASGLVDKLRACQHLKLLFLNGCNNARQVQRFVEIGIPATIGTSIPIMDDIAREFSEYFYTELAVRRMPVSSAFEQARATITTKKGEQHQTLNMRSLDESITTGYQPEWSWFLEQTHEHDWKLEEAAHPCNRLPVLPTKSLAQLPDEPFKNLYYYTPDDAEIFFGRCQPALDILECLTDERHPLLLLHGGSGVGKSSFLMAGLIPRLRARQQPASDPTRYDEKLNLTPQYLLANLFGSDDPDVIHKQLDATGEQPAIWILDQLEEIFFKPESEEDGKPGNDVASTLSKDDQQDNIPDALNQLLKILQTLFPHNQPKRWPNARIILSLRTEWFGELHDACRRYQLGSRDYLLKPLSKADIIEVIEQPARTPLLVKKYGLQIEQLPNGRLAEQIADDLLEDKGSNIAPPLQIMLSKLWQKVKHLPVEERIWTQALYEQQKAQGLLLSEHLDQQLREIGEFDNWGKRAYDSGLLLDVLHAHTTLQGTARTLPLAEYHKRYTHIPFREKLAKNLTDRYLLVDPLNDKKQLRLAHDSLATLVKARYEISDLPGQRAQRVLHSRKADWKQVNKGEYKGTALDTYDLKLVEQGESGTRDWQQDELETAIVHKSRKKRRNGRIAVGSVVVTLVLAFVATVFLYLQAEEQRRLTEEQVLETNYSLAKAFEEKAMAAFDRGNSLTIGDPNRQPELRHALLYALEAQRSPLPKGQTAVIPETLSRLSALDLRALSPERKKTPRLNLQEAVNSLSYSPDGKFIASNSYGNTVRLWDVQTGQKIKTLQGHSNAIQSVSYSPDGRFVASGSYDNTVRLWDAESGESLKVLQGHQESVYAVAFSPNGEFVISGSADNTIRLWDVQTGEQLKTLHGHAGGVWSVMFSPDGDFIASGSEDNTVWVWDVKTGRNLQRFQGHEGYIYSIAYSPDGHFIASGSADKTVRIWDVRNGTNPKTLKGHEDVISSITYTPDGRLIASGSTDKTVRIWDAKSGENLKVLQGHQGSVYTVAYSPDGQSIASGSYDKTVRFWNVQSGKSLTVLEGQGHFGWISAVVFSPDGQFIASGATDNTVRLWNFQNGENLKTLRGHAGAINSVDYSPDGKFLVSGSKDNTVRLWDVKTGESLRIFQVPGERSSIWSVAFSPDGKFIASGSEDNIVRLWDVKNGKNLEIMRGHAGGITSLSYSSNGRLLASGSGDNSIQMWNVENGDSLKIFHGHEGAVNSVVFSPDGQSIASGSSDNTLRLWDVKTGENLKTLKSPQDQAGWVSSVAYSPDGRFIASGHSDNTVLLWDIQSGEVLKNLQWHEPTNLDFSIMEYGSGAVSALAYSPNGNFIISASDDHTVRLWDLQNKGNMNTLQESVEPIWSVSYSPDGRSIVSGSDWYNLQLWDVNSGKNLKTLQGHSDSIWSVSYSPDGKSIVSGSEDNTVRLWDVETGESLKILQGHEARVNSVVYSPDGRIVVSGSADNTVRLWSVKSGESLNVLHGHEASVNSVAYSPDGFFIASSSDDQLIRLWDAQSGEISKVLQGHSNRIKTVAFSPDGRFVASGSADKTIRFWDVQSGESLKILRGHESMVTSLAYSPDGHFIASSAADNTVRVWDTQNGKNLKIFRGHLGGIWSVAYSPDGQYIVSGSTDKMIRLWKPDDPSPILRFLYDFNPIEVADALEFLWNLRLDGLQFIENYPEPALLPSKDYYITWNEENTKYRTLLDAPRSDETKMDQLVRFLEVQCAYKKPEDKADCLKSVTQ